MKANELMVGDWVKFPIGNDKVVDLPYIEGRGICASFAASATLFPVEIDKIEPVSLTPEILEKNGWFYPPQSIWMKLDSPYGELWGCEHTDGTLWLYSSAELDKHDAFAEIRYVHELQHALRLCGIEKEIEL
jgi:hypothetical protein